MFVIALLLASGAGPMSIMCWLLYIAIRDSNARIESERKRREYPSAFNDFQK